MAVQTAAWMKRPVVTLHTPCTQIQGSALGGLLGKGCPFCPHWEPPVLGFVRRLRGSSSVLRVSADWEAGARGQGRPLSGSILLPSGKALSCWESPDTRRLGETTAHQIWYAQSVVWVCAQNLHKYDV